MVGKTGIKFHWPSYQYMGPGMKLKKRLAQGDPGITRLDQIAKQHNIDYSKAKAMTELIVKGIMQTKKRFKL